MLVTVVDVVVVVVVVIEKISETFAMKNIILNSKNGDSASPRGAAREKRL